MFIGYHTVYGPNGYIEAATHEAVETEAASLLDKYPNAQSGAIRRPLLQRGVWRTAIWSKMELAGND